MGRSRKELDKWLDAGHEVDEAPAPTVFRSPKEALCAHDGELYVGVVDERTIDAGNIPVVKRKKLAAQFNGTTPRATIKLPPDVVSLQERVSALMEKGDVDAAHNLKMMAIRHQEMAEPCLRAILGIVKKNDHKLASLGPDGNPDYYLKNHADLSIDPFVKVAYFALPLAISLLKDDTSAFAINALTVIGRAYDAATADVIDVLAGRNTDEARVKIVYISMMKSEYLPQGIKALHEMEPEEAWRVALLVMRKWGNYSNQEWSDCLLESLKTYNSHISVQLVSNVGKKQLSLRPAALAILTKNGSEYAVHEIASMSLSDTTATMVIPYLHQIQTKDSLTTLGAIAERFVKQPAIFLPSLEALLEMHDEAVDPFLQKHARQVLANMIFVMGDAKNLKNMFEVSTPEQLSQLVDVFKRLDDLFGMTLMTERFESLMHTCGPKNMPDAPGPMPV